MHSGVIVVKKAGEAISKDFWERALAENKSYMGASIVNDDGIIEVSGTNDPDKINFEEIDGIQQEYLANTIVYYVCNNPEGAISAESMQPYTLVDAGDEDKPVLVAFIEGEFPGYREEKSAHSDAFFLVEKYLREKIMKIFKMCQNDWDLVKAELDEPTTAREFMNCFVDRGTITLMLSTGEVKTFNSKDNPLSGDIPGGWASKTYAAAPNVLQTTAATVKKAFGFGKSKGPVIADLKNGAATPPPPPVVDKPAAAPVEDPGLEGAPPQGTTKEQKKAWYKEHHAIRDTKTGEGVVPQGYKNGPRVKMKAPDPKAPIKSFAELKPPGVGHNGGPPIADTQSVTDKQKNMVDIDSLIPPHEKSFIVDKFLRDANVIKVMDAGGHEAVDPKKIDQLPSRRASFVSQVGQKKLRPFLNLTLKQCQEFCGKSPNAAGLLMSELMFHAQQSTKMDAEAPQTQTEQKPVETQPAAPAPQPEPAPAQAEPAPQKQFGFGRRKKAS